MSLAERRRLRLFTLCVLYVAQGIPWGFMATTLPAYLTDRGLDLSFVAATLSFTTLPYAFKWVWGPIIDSITIPRFGRRRTWIVFAQAMMVITVSVLITMDLVVEVRMLAWMVLIHTVFNALQDVAVDALAIDVLDEAERGRANAFMYGSKYGGGFLGGLGMVTVIGYFGLETALIAQSTVLLAIMLVPLFIRESDRAPPPRIPFRQIAEALVQAFSVRSALVAALLMLVSQLAVATIGATGYKLFIGELRWDYVEYTRFTGGWGLLIGGACAISTGFLVDRYGRRAMAAFASCALAGGWIGFALLSSWWTEHWLVYVFASYEAAAQAILSVSLISICMDLSWARIAATQFAAFMALSNFSTTLGYQFAARANELWDFEGIYLICALAQLALIGFLPFIDRTETRRKLPLPDGASRNWLGIVSLVALLGFLVAMTAYVTRLKLG